MAKTGMNIGADGVLVSSAGSLARSMGPADMTKSMDGILKARGDMLDSMEKNFKKTTELIDGGNAELKETVALIQEKLNNGDLTSTERDELQARMDDYRARMKEIPFGRKGRKAREDLMYEVNREIKTAKNRDAAMVDVLTTIDNDLYDPTQLDPNYINFLNQIGKSAAEEETDPGFAKTKNEKGETIYSYTYTDEAGEEQKIEGTVFDIQNKINGTKKDFEFITQQNEVIFEWEKWAKEHPNAKFDEVYSRISSNMETSFAQSPGKFKSIINHPMGWNKKSYVETLRDPQSPEFQNVIKILDEMNASDFDYDGDGSITEADFVNEENINTMIQALTDPSATQRRTAHRAAATFYADTEARKAFDFGVRDRPKTGGGEGSGKADPKNPSNLEESKHQVNRQTLVFGVPFKKQVRQSIKDRVEVNGNFGTYIWNEPTDEALGYYTGPEGNQLTPFQVASREYSLGTDGSSHRDFATGSDDGSGGVVDSASLTGDISWRTINVENDDIAVSNINDYFADTNFSDRYQFDVMRSRAGFDAIGSDAITIIDTTTGKMVENTTFGEGHPLYAVSISEGVPIYNIPTGLLGEENSQKIMDLINSIDILAPYIDQKKRKLVDENEAYGNVNP